MSAVSAVPSGPQGSKRPLDGLSENLLAATAREGGLIESVPQLLDAVEVDVDSSGQLLEIVARGSDPQTATVKADAYAQAAAEALVDYPTLGAGPVFLESFETGTAEWNRMEPRRPLVPATVSITRSTAKFGVTSLALRCTGAQACGAWRTLRYPFRPGRQYLVTAWLRAEEASSTAAGPRFSLGLTGAGDDSVSGTSVAFPSGWKRSEIAWKPERRTEDAEFSVEIKHGARADLLLDSLALWEVGKEDDPEVAAPISVERRAVNNAPLVTLFPARAAGPSSPTGTWRWALLGAVIGLLIGVAAAAAAAAAAARRRPPPTSS